ncbi:radical SAM protein [bacterium]|nr:radical SAM protein [bacterium]
MRLKRALLINPPSGLYIREDRCQVPVKGLTATAPRPPIDLAYIAAVLEQEGVECRIKDYPVEGKGWSALERDLEIFSPDILIVSVTTPTFELDMKACEIAKKLNPSIITAAKGGHITVLDEEALKKHPYLDIALRGEVEETVKELAQGYQLDKIEGITFRSNGRIIRNPDRKFIEDLDSLPFPARHLLDNSLYKRPDTNEPQTTIQTNRGCPGQCVFCLAGKLSGRKLRLRSPKNIVDEIEECINKFNIRNFFFRADTFTWNKEWVIEICKEILRRNLNIKWVCNSRVDTLDEERLRWMKASGCWLISLGIESGSQRILNLMGKAITKEDAKRAVELCKKYKIKSYAFYLFGLPWEREIDVFETIKFALELDSDYAEFHLAVPFPGTVLYDIVREKNLIEGDFQGYDHSIPIARTFYISREELLRWRRKAIFRFYLRPRYIFRTILHSPSPLTLFSYARFAIERILLLPSMYKKATIELIPSKAR